MAKRYTRRRPHLSEADDREDGRIEDRAQTALALKSFAQYRLAVVGYSFRVIDIIATA